MRLSKRLTIRNLKRVIIHINEHGFWHTLIKIRQKLTTQRNPIVLQKAKDKLIQELYKSASEKSEQYVHLAEENVELGPEDIKYVAFYLPQFHPIKENDKWWGKGFTEWTNVSKAVPQFPGHYQPHLPGELGFYDLRIPDVMKRQAELAKKYGIYGFCFHYYWFGGKRLLEKPLNQFLENQDIDLPFSLCWANENWTRRWDGDDEDILMQQKYSLEDDINLIKDLIPVFKDKRYIRIEGRPILLVYRPDLLPDPKGTAKRWRDFCKQQGVEEVYLVAVQSFNFKDHRVIDFDASVEFPPHAVCADIITHKMPILNPEFEGVIFSYDSIVKSKKYLNKVPYKVFKTVCPGWDNTARKPNYGHIFHGANPGIYKEWLTDVTRLTKASNNKDEQIVFINAWNEWAEGAHLEPDRKFGYGYLQATADVIKEVRNSDSSE